MSQFGGWTRSTGGLVLMILEGNARKSLARITATNLHDELARILRDSTLVNEPAASPPLSNGSNRAAVLRRCPVGIE